MHTPKHQEYVTAYLAEVDAKVAAAEKDFRERLADGREHVVAITPKRELGRHMDAPTWSEMDLHGPMSYGVAKWITEQDARILYVNGALKLIEGNEDTLFNHRFRTREELYRPDQTRQREEQRYTCKCGKVLDYNTVGVNRKLGMDEYQCLDCLGIDEEYAQSVITHYRGSGCNMFI